jgi:hypothetical protein
MPRSSDIPRLSWAEACARRLARHGLVSPRPGATPTNIASAMCGAHAQVMAAAELSIGLRGDGLTREHVREALWRDRSLTKTFGPRTTVHLLATEDLPMWIAALGAVPSRRVAPDRAGLLDACQAEAVVEAIAGALEDAELTVDELGAEVVARTGPWAGELVMEAFQGKWPRWRAAIGQAAVRGVLCFGPERGRRVTYTNPHRWMGAFRPADPDAALGELLRRYLHAYGPARPEDFARWLAAAPRWAEDLFQKHTAGLRHVELEGTTAWELDEDAGSAAPAGDSGVLLLPYFDAYVVGSQPRELLFPGAAWGRALARGQAGNYPVVLVDDTVAGVWHGRRAGGRLAVTVELLSEVTPRHVLQLGEQVERIGRIMQAEPSLTMGEVTVGAHA